VTGEGEDDAPVLGDDAVGQARADAGEQVLVDQLLLEVLELLRGRQAPWGAERAYDGEVTRSPVRLSRPCVTDTMTTSGIPKK
jgi:hypothetical protein